ncbi:MAG: helix-turn-helix transcriptional regulator [Bacilli bacterium]|nr:helix-turn-helix transcriptional regulator [Bacilli bacterium]
MLAGFLNSRNKWENGNGIPSDVNLEVICEFFGVEEGWLLDRKDIKKMVENLDKKNSKVLWFVLGIVTPLLLMLLSILGFFEWRCPGEICPAIYVSPKGILILLAENNIIIATLVLLIYLYQIVFSIIYWIKDFKNGKLIQIINFALSVVCFIVTFIIAYNIGIEKNFILFFM